MPVDPQWARATASYTDFFLFIIHYDPAHTVTHAVRGEVRITLGSLETVVIR